jgi:competence protein ComEC
MVNVILLAALLILGANPLELYDTGFQLSFSGLLAIVLLMPIVSPALTWLYEPPRIQNAISRKCAAVILWMARTISTAFLVSVAVMVGTWPVIAYVFNSFSIVAVAANALTALLVLALTAVGGTSIAVGLVWPWLGHGIAMVALWLSVALLSVVTQLADCPWASISTGTPSAISITAYYLCLLIALEFAYRRLGRRIRTNFSRR